MDIKQLQKDIHENAVNHGWWETKRPIPELLCLIHSEVSELFEAFMEKGLTEVSEETADIVIRILDMTAGYGLNYDISRFVNPLKKVNLDFSEKLDFKQWILSIHGSVSECLEFYRKTGELENHSIITIFVTVFGFAEAIGIDLISEVKKKHEINKTREYRHGNKVC